MRNQRRSRCQTVAFAVITLWSVAYGTANGGASSPTIDTVAGGFFLENAPAKQIGMNPYLVRSDKFGDIYFNGGSGIAKLNTATMTVTNVVGNQVTGYAGDGGPATSAQINGVAAIATDDSGNLYLADTGNHVIRKVGTDGVIHAVAGLGYPSDAPCIVGSSALDCGLIYPGGVAVSHDGDLFVSDGYHQRIIRINQATGNVTAVAGTGTTGYSGDGGPASLANLSYPGNLAISPDNQVYFVDGGNYAVRKWNISAGTIDTFAGNGTSGSVGNGGPARLASFGEIRDIAFDKDGNLLVSDTGTETIRKVTADGEMVSVFAGIPGAWGATTDGAVPTETRLYKPFGITVTPSGDVYFSNGYNWVISNVSSSDGLIRNVAGCGLCFYGDGQLASSAQFGSPMFVTNSPDGDLFISVTGQMTVRRVDRKTSRVTTVAGNGVYGFSGDGGPATHATFYFPRNITRDDSGNLYVMDSYNGRIRKIDSVTGVVTTVAGKNTSGCCGSWSNPDFGWGKLIYKDGFLFLADEILRVVSKIDLATGNVETIAGNRSQGFSGDGGPATSAQFMIVSSIALDTAGNILIADQNRIRKLDSKTGLIDTIAGTGANASFGDGGPALAAGIRVGDLYVDWKDDIYFTDGDTRIRRIRHDTGIVETIVGDDFGGFSGDGGPANLAKIRWPGSLTMDNQGNLYFADNGSSRIRVVRGVSPKDSSPPVVAPSVTGTIGAAGWYVGDVIVAWSTSDLESPISTSTGCGQVIVTSDVTDTIYTCTASSAGGTTTESVTIKRDATAPTATTTPSPLPNGAGWHKASVSVAFSGTDATSGVASCSSNLSITTEGRDQKSGSGTCTDVAGNVSAPVSYSPINIDLTPPAVSAVRVPTANATGWNNTAVTVSYSAIDTLSGVAADGCTGPKTFATNGAAQSSTGTCTDLSGNSASVSVSGINIDLAAPTATASVSPAANVANWHRTPVTVSFAGTDALSGSGVLNCSAPAIVVTDGAGQARTGVCTDLADNVSATASATVNLDQTAPNITVTTPAGGATYTQNAVVTAAYFCSDALSSIAACIGTVPSGSVFSTSNLGTNSFTVQATDLAGNSTSKAVTYTVTAPSPFTLSPAALAFGNRLVNSSTALAMTIRNTSTATLALTAPKLSGTNANQFTLSRTCGTSLVAGASCTVTATFKPTSPGPKTAAFALRVGTATQTVPLSGNGVAVAFMVSPTSLVFPGQTRNTTSASQTVTVTNSVAFPITLSSITLGGTNSNQYVKTQTCGTSLAANASCTVSIAFKPTSAGTKTATLTVTPSGTTAKAVSISGIGL